MTMFHCLINELMNCCDIKLVRATPLHHTTLLLISFLQQIGTACVLFLYLFEGFRYQKKKYLT